MPRIAITGASGTGKTTLAKNLSKYYNSPLIKEDIGLILDSQAEIYQNLSHGDSITELLTQHIKTCLKHLESQTQTFSCTSSFISDRFGVDILGRLLRSPFDKIGEEAFQKVLLNVQLQSKYIDLAVVTPLSDWSFTPSANDTGLTRNTSLLQKTRAHSIYAGLCLSILDCPVVFLQPSSDGKSSWTDDVTEAVGKI